MSCTVSGERVQHLGEREPHLQVCIIERAQCSSRCATFAPASASLTPIIEILELAFTQTLDCTIWQSVLKTCQQL
jgi:hypothetical protein